MSPLRKLQERDNYSISEVILRDLAVTAPGHQTLRSKSAESFIKEALFSVFYEQNMDDRN